MRLVRLVACLSVVAAVAFAVGVGARAQQAASTANAAESKVQPPAANSVPPGWLAEKWSAIVGFFAWGPERGRAPNLSQVAGSPPQVTVSRPVVRQVTEWDEYTGRFDAVDTIEVRARVSGFLTAVHFVDGQAVRKGDPLFTIDPRPFERTLATARAEFVQARTKVESTQKDVDRGRPLLDRKVISEKTFDDRENLMREAEAAVTVAEAKVKSAELDLSFTSIDAPLPGRIGRNLVSIGNYVNGGGSGTQTVLTTIVTQDPIQFYFDVSEANAIKYQRLGLVAADKVGQPGAVIELALSDDKGFPHTGKLDFKDNRLDTATSTLRMRAIVDNKSGLFSPGMFGRARISGSAPYQATLLPDSAIGNDQASKYVAVVAEDGSVTRKVVTLGPLAFGMRVVRTGLAADDWVIINGQQRARPGLKVNAKREPLQVSSAAPEASPAATR